MAFSLWVSLCFACWQASCLSLVPPFPSNCVPCFGPAPRPMGRLLLASVSFWSRLFEGKGWQKGCVESYEVLMHVLSELNGALLSLKCCMHEYREKKKREISAKPGERGQGNLILHELECSCIALSINVHSSKSEAQKGNA